MSPQAGRLLVEQVVPRMKTTFRGIRRVGPEDEEELFQDGLALAAKMLDDAERNGKDVTAGNIVWYAGKRLATGRRSNYVGRMDAMSPAAQLDGNSHLTSLQQDVARDPESGEEQECAPCRICWPTPSRTPHRRPPATSTGHSSCPAWTVCPVG